MTDPVAELPDICIPDIRITVQVWHVPGYSTPDKQAFQYIVTIDNHSEESWQLMARHWEIADSSGQTIQVDGEGVVGEQPVLPPGGRFTYDSFVTIAAPPGLMFGHYLMRDAWGQLVQIPIPVFRLALGETGERVLN